MASLSDLLNTHINTVLNTYIKKISSKYNINEKELLDIWSGGSTTTTITSPVKKTITNSNSELNKLNRSELIELCKAKGIKVSGRKNELVERLENFDDSKTQTLLKKVLTTKVQKKNISETVVQKKLIEKVPTIQITRNKFGNFEHSETHFVLDNKTQKVYGKQNDDGSISELTVGDINLCNKYKFSYVIPDNLDKKDGEDEDDLEEVDEELDEEELEDELEEEELEEDEEYYEE